MVLLGLLLMAGTAAFAGLLIAYNLSGGPEYTVSLLGSEPFTISMLGAFLGGIALTLIFGLGLWMLTAGAVLARHRSKKRRGNRTVAARTAPERDERTGRPVDEDLGGTPGDTADRPREAAHRPHRFRLHGHSH
jgi:hypothetical protein